MRKQLFSTLLHLTAISLIAVFLLSSAAAKQSRSKSKKKTVKKEQPVIEVEKPLHQQDFKNIIAKYAFVADFNVKPETRPLTSEEVFWRYPLKIQKNVFPFAWYENDDLLHKAFPATSGDGRDFQHLNRGRQLFLEGNYEEARTTWLSARARFGKENEYHRRIDYFIGQAFFRLGMKEEDPDKKRRHFHNAATFYSWAYQVKADLKDSLLDQEAPRVIYNLAAIYYLYDRYAAAFGAAHDGLALLRQHGRSEFKPSFRRLVAESYIQNRSYLEAVQEFDQTLRENVDTKTAAAIFARVGDIYFDLNNFELADDAYSLAGRIDQEALLVHPSRFVLRGESLFWMGQFSEAQNMFHYARSSENFPHSAEQLTYDFAAVASIRMADGWLGRTDFKKIDDAKMTLAAIDRKAESPRALQVEKGRAKDALKQALMPLEKARLAYFRHADEFRNHPSALDAKIRLACLELPEYEGKNIQHARDLLSELKNQKTTSESNRDQIPLPEEAIHMAWACETASYAQHERTKEMVERVRTFVGKYPQSRFLNQLIEPVREVQARDIEPYFQRGDLYGATSFFEKTRKLLYQTVPDNLAIRLFNAYADINHSDKAGEFWAVARKRVQKDIDYLRLATVAAENGSKGVWKKRNTETVQLLRNRKWTTPPDELPRLYVSRLLSANEAPLHLPWLYTLVRQWSDKNALLTCDFVYPVLSRLWDQKNVTKKDRAWVQQEAADLIDKRLVDIFHTQPSCGYSLMEFESRLYRTEMKRLAERIATRTSIPIDPVTANIIWTLSERLYQNQDNASAQNLWRYLRDNGSGEIVEVKYAKARLDNRRTEFEKLWGD